MIKRLNKATDQLDIIVCKDDMFARNVKRIIYYTQGHKNTYIEPEFEVQNDVLVIALPTQELETLQAGILMRDVEYIVEDALYPDGKRNLILTDNMNVYIC
jgi:hypothetical protein